MKLIQMILALLPTCLLAGCTHDEMVRSETMTAGAGNAMAYNSALQIIDPRPLTSLDTRITVPPASRAGDVGTAAAGYGAVAVSQ